MATKNTCYDPSPRCDDLGQGRRSELRHASYLASLEHLDQLDYEGSPYGNTEADKAATYDLWRRDPLTAWCDDYTGLACNEPDDLPF
jgi:hypothetical protein